MTQEVPKWHPSEEELMAVANGTAGSETSGRVIKHFTTGRCHACAKRIEEIRRSFSKPGGQRY